MISHLETVWRSIGDLAGELAPDEWRRPTELPGWTVQDCLSHIVGTERMLAGDPPAEVDVDHLPHVTSGFAAMMEAPVEARRSSDAATVLAEFHEVTGRRLQMLRSLTEEEWSTVGWSPIGEVPYREFMHLRAFDCWMHEQDMRRAVDRPGHLDGPVAALSIDRVRRAMGYVVGKRVGAPDGTTVRFDITGPEPVTFALRAGGRAHEVDPPSDPTVSLRLDGETFCALGGGRWSAATARDAGRVACTGDTGLGERILADMSITP